jgi:hypothetical protein
MSISSTAPSDVGPLVVKPKDARRMLNCGHTRLYELLGAGQLESFLDGRSRKITVESIRRYISRRLEASSSIGSISAPGLDGENRKVQRKRPSP